MAPVGRCGRVVTMVVSLCEAVPPGVWWSCRYGGDNGSDILMGCSGDLWMGWRHW